MIDMTSWPELDVDVLDDVELDSENIRLEAPVDAPQPDIMRDIFANGEALSLVEGIVKVGYLTHEIPIVVERNGRIVVVEGNRRLAALKAIQNPYLVPEYQARITTLTASLDGRDALRIIRVKKAPNQDEANQVIAAIHTSNIRAPWKPPRQAAFFQAQVDAGKTLPVLLREYPMSSVRRFVRASQLLNKFRSASYRDPTLSDFLRSAKFPTTTLARIYESAEFNRILGIEMRPNGSIKMVTTDARFNRIAIRIISGMKSGELTARTMPKTNSAKFVELMAELQAIVDEPARHADGDQAGHRRSSSTHGDANDRTDAEHNKSGDGTSTGSGGHNGPGYRSSGTGDTETGDDISEKPASTDQKQSHDNSGEADERKRKSSLRLDPYGLQVPQTYPLALAKIFDELVEINVQKYPNAVMDLLRTFLEKVIKAYARSGRGTIVPKNGTNVQLTDCLTWLIGHVASLPDHRSLSAVINRIQSRNLRQYPTSAAYLNDINHNPDVFATPSDAHDLWEAMISLMQLMLK